MRKYEVKVYYYPLNFCSPAWHYNASVQLLNAPDSNFRCFVGISIESKENHPKTATYRIIKIRGRFQPLTYLIILYVFCVLDS